MNDVLTFAVVGLAVAIAALVVVVSALPWPGDDERRADQRRDQHQQHDAPGGRAGMEGK